VAANAKASIGNTKITSRNDDVNDPVKAGKDKSDEIETKDEAKKSESLFQGSTVNISSIPKASVEPPEPPSASVEKSLSKSAISGNSLTGDSKSSKQKTDNIDASGGEKKKASAIADFYSRAASIGNSMRKITSNLQTSLTNKKEQEKNSSESRPASTSEKSKSQEVEKGYSEKSIPSPKRNSESLRRDGKSQQSSFAKAVQNTFLDTSKLSTNAKSDLAPSKNDVLAQPQSDSKMTSTSTKKLVSSSNDTDNQQPPSSNKDNVFEENTKSSVESPTPNKKKFFMSLDSEDDNKDEK